MRLRWLQNVSSFTDDFTVFEESSLCTWKALSDLLVVLFWLENGRYVFTNRYMALYQC
jgi:hypothetical protein